MLSNPTLRRATASALAIIIAFTATAQDPPASQPGDFPTADDIFLRSVVAMSGQENWEDKESMSFKVATPELLGRATVTVQSSKPDLLRCSMTIPNQGALELIQNGTHIWLKEPGVKGFMSSDDDERTQMMTVLFAPQVYLFTAWNRYPDRETVDQVEFGGNECHQVELSSQDESGSATLFFDAATSEFAGANIPSPFGEPAPFVIDDWAEIDGVRVIRAATISFAGQAMSFKYSDHTFTEIDDSVFAKPADVNDDDDGESDDDGGGT